MLQERKNQLFKQFPLSDVDIDRVKVTMASTYAMYVEGMGEITSGITLENENLYATGEKKFIKAYEEVRSAGRLFSLMKKADYESKRDELNGRIGRARISLEGHEDTEITLSRKLTELRRAIIEEKKELIELEAEKELFEENWKELKENGFRQ